MNKNKIFKIIFLISFLPYIILLLLSIYSAIFGHDTYTWLERQYIETLYGIEAFKETIIWCGLGMCMVPILPTAVIIQIIYIVKCMKNKREIEQ